jgi:hypothetical protein
MGVELIGNCSTVMLELGDLMLLVYMIDYI